jgi:MFS family permease
MTFSVGYIGQFIWLYLFEVAEMSNTRANVMLVVMPLVTLFIFNPVWGRLIDRLGCKPVLIIAGLSIVHGSLAWVFITKDQWVVGYLAIILATAAWPGIELANFNIMLRLSDRYAGKPERSGYVAVNSLFGALAGVLSGLFGGAVAEAFKDWHGSLFGWPLTYHGLLFLISGGLRLAALGWLIGLEDPKAYTTRAALRYMGSNFYSNLQQAVFLPGRLLQRVTHWTYTVKPAKPTGKGDQ